MSALVSVGLASSGCLGNCVNGKTCRSCGQKGKPLTVGSAAAGLLTAEQRIA